MTKPRAPALGKIALAVISLAIVVLALEVGLRLLPGTIPLLLLKEFEPMVRSAIAAHRNLQRAADTVIISRDDGGPPEEMWLYKPGTEVSASFPEAGIVAAHRMDDMGFCNAPAGLYATTAQFDIVALGDSFTWCAAVAPAEAWPSVLADLMQRRTYNFGLPGRGVYEELQVLKAYGLAKSPEVVVLNVYEGNDLRDAVHYYEAKTATPDSPVQPACQLEWAPACAAYHWCRGSALWRVSYAANFLSAALWRSAARVQNLTVDFGYDVEVPHASSVRFNATNSDRNEVLFARRVADGLVSPAVFDAALQSFVELSQRYGFIPVVSYTPAAYSAYDGMIRFEDPGIVELMRDYSARLRGYFARRAPELGYQFLDLTPTLRAAARDQPAGELLYFSTNVHLTPLGHRVVAGALADFLAPLPQRAPVPAVGVAGPLE